MLPAEQVGVFVDGPELGRRPAECFADPLEDLWRRLTPTLGIGQWPGDRKLHIPEALADAPLADVRHEGDEADPRPGPGRRGNRDLNRELAAVAMERRQLHGPAEQPAFTRFDEPRQPAAVGLAITTRNDGPGKGPANRLIVRPAEDRLGLAVPVRDHSPLIRGDHRARRGIDDDLQPLLRVLERLHDPQLDFGVPAGGGIQTGRPGEERGAGEKQEGVPHIPEAVVPGPHEKEDHRLDGDEHEADTSPALQPPIGASSLSIGCGGEGNREEGHSLQRGVEIRKSSVDDERRKHVRERDQRRDAQAGEAACRHDRAP